MTVSAPPSESPAPALLAPDEPPAFSEWRTGARSSFVLAVDHASPYVPRSLRQLGLPASELARHIAWDIGALAVAREVAEALDAVLIAQNYSRLVIDCNRDPAAASSVPTESEWTRIPGNIGLSAQQLAARRREIFDPYHARLAALLEARRQSNRPTILVAQHSMTEIFKGAHRSMHCAVLYNRDRRFAGRVLEALQSDPALLVSENEPYFMSDATDYTIPHHAESRGLPYVEIEVRQDLIRDVSGQRAWAARIAAALRQAQEACFG